MSNPTALAFAALAPLVAQLSLRGARAVSIELDNPLIDENASIGILATIVGTESHAGNELSWFVAEASKVGAPVKPELLERGAFLGEWPNDHHQIGFEWNGPQQADLLT